MWEGHIDALKYYFNVMVAEWIGRGFNNNMEVYEVKEPKVVPLHFDGTTTIYQNGYTDEYDKATHFPWWFGWKPMMLTHQASLCRKDPIFYTFNVPPDFMYSGYIWPSKHPPSVWFENFNMNMLEPIGAGAPPHYRYTKDEVIAWNEKRSINPKTGRKISESSAIYQDYLSAYEVLILKQT